MLYIECKPDLTLVKFVTKIPKRKITHTGGKSEVCRKLERQKNCIGLVDEDPESIQPPYLQKMKVRSDLLKYGFIVRHDDSSGNYLIILTPRLEEWILKAAKEAKVDVREYGLPNNPIKFHKEINTKLDKLEKLISGLKGQSKRIKTLRKILEKKA